jgi:hypothetical protein
VVGEPVVADQGRSVQVGPDDTVLDGALGAPVAVPGAPLQSAEGARARPEVRVALVVLETGQEADPCDALALGQHLADRPGTGQPATSHVEQPEPLQDLAVGSGELRREQLVPGADAEAGRSPVDGLEEPPVADQLLPGQEHRRVLASTEEVHVAEPGDGVVQPHLDDPAAYLTGTCPVREGQGVAPVAVRAEGLRVNQDDTDIGVRRHV